MKIIKEIIKKIPIMLSRVVIYLIPKELYVFFKLKEEEKVYHYYRKKEILECFNHFEKHLQNAVHMDVLSIRKYAIERSLLNDKEENKFYLEF